MTRDADAKQERKSGRQVEQFWQMVLNISKSCTGDQLQRLVGAGDALKALAWDSTLIFSLRRAFRFVEVRYGIPAETVIRERWEVRLMERNPLVPHPKASKIRYFRFLDCGRTDVARVREIMESGGFRPVTLCELNSFLDNPPSFPFPIALNVLDVAFLYDSHEESLDLRLMIDGDKIEFVPLHLKNPVPSGLWLCILGNWFMG